LYKKFQAPRGLSLFLYEILKLSSLLLFSGFCFFVPVRLQVRATAFLPAKMKELPEITFSQSRVVATKTAGDPKPLFPMWILWGGYRVTHKQLI